MPKITITKQEAIDILEGDTLVIRNNIIENNRWTLLHELIFRYQRKLYRTYYRVGSTELQDESPFEYDDTVTCVEVTPIRAIDYAPAPEPIATVIRRKPSFG